MRVLVLGDPHLPAPDWELLKEAYEFNKSFKAHRIVCVGDLTDQKTWSKYGRDTDDVGNDEEWELTIQATQRFIKIFPRMDVIIGNHDVRYFKAANLAGVPSKLVKSLSEALPAPGWKWHDTSRGPLMLDGVGYIHGDEQSGSALAKASFVGHPIVQGHDHKGILEYSQPPHRRGPLWGMSSGCTADLQGPGMRYAKKMLRKAFSCFAVVEDGVPRIYPKGTT
jgi:predicted phosphodiesterase